MIWNCIKFLIMTEFTLFFNHCCHGDDSMCHLEKKVQIESDTTCTQNCSQLSPRIEGDTVTFECSIGGKKDVDNFKTENPDAFQPDAPKIFQAPTMLGVEYYHKIFNSNQVHSLKITFQLPQGVPKQVADKGWQFPKAVLMKFTSVNEMEYKDEFYFNCSKERIFMFRNYTPIHTYDVVNPRNLTFDCIVGLDGSMIKAAYLVTLTTEHGHSVVYVVLVNIQTRDNNEPWIPVVITYFNEKERSIYTVIEIPPANYMIDNVQLFMENKPLKTQKLNGNGNSTTFSNMTRGKYYIMVNSSCKKDLCNKTTQTKSLMIDASHLPDEYYPIHTLDGTLGPVQISAIVMGLVAVTVLLALMYFMRYHKKRNTNHNSSDMKLLGIMMHPFTNNDAMHEVIKCFENFLIHDCDCFLKTSRETETDLPEQHKYGNILNNARFAIVFCDCNSHAKIDDYYRNAVNEIWKRRKQHNDIRIIIVTVSLPHKENCMQGIVHQADTGNGALRTDKFILKHDIEKLYCKIHETTEEKHLNSTLYKNGLEIAIAKFKENEPSNETKLPFPREFGAQLIEINEFPKKLVVDDTETNTACVSSTSQHRQAGVHCERENTQSLNLHAVCVPGSPCQTNKINKHIADLYHFNTDNEFSSQAGCFVQSNVLANNRQGSLSAHTEHHTCFQTGQHIYNDNEQHSHIVDGHCNPVYCRYLSELKKLNTDVDYHDGYRHNDKHDMDAANHTHHMDTTSHATHFFPSIKCNGPYVHPPPEHSIIQHNGSSPKVIPLTEQMAQSNIHQTLFSNEHNVQTNKHRHIMHEKNPNVRMDYQFGAKDPLLSDSEACCDDSIHQYNVNCQSNDSIQGHIRSTHSLPAQLDRISYGHDDVHDCFQCFNPIPPSGSDESMSESLLDAMTKINSVIYK